MSSPSSHDDAAHARARDERASHDEASRDSALAEQAASSRARGPAPLEAPEVPASTAPPPASIPVARPDAPLSRPLPRRFFLVMGPIAAAAAIVLALALRPADTLLPGYELTVAAAKSGEPVAATTEALLDPAGDFELVARPAVPSARVTARALLVRDGSASAWNVPVDVSPDGVVRIVGKSATLFENVRGAATVVLLLAYGARQPSVAEARRIAEGKREADPGLRVVRADLRFLDP